VPPPVAAAPAVSPRLTGSAGSGLLSSPLGGTAFGLAGPSAGPAATPLGTLLDTNPALAATTASQVQAMALQGPANSTGTPVMLAVLALALVAGLAVRYRVVTRARRRELAAHDDLAEGPGPAADDRDDVTLEGADDGGSLRPALAGTP
jgi:hypothetical protein